MPNHKPGKVKRRHRKCVTRMDTKIRITGAEALLMALEVEGTEAIF